MVPQAAASQVRYTCACGPMRLKRGPLGALVSNTSGVFRTFSALLLCALTSECRRTEIAPPVSATAAPAASAAPTASVKPPPGAEQVAPGVYMVQKFSGAGRAWRLENDGEVLRDITVSVGERDGKAAIVASVEEMRWSKLAPWWCAALADAKIGSIRQIWFCSEESKHEWRDLARQPCVVAEVELTKYRASEVK